MGGSCSTNEREEDAYRLLVGKPQGKRDHYEDQDNIRMDLGDVAWCDVDWIGLVQDKNRWRDIVNSLLNLRVP
jgi:hypothetical protein